MSGHLPGENDPLPQQTLDTMHWLNRKDERIKELEDELGALVYSWRYDGDLTLDEINKAEGVLRGVRS